MESSLDDEIREQLRRYVAGEITLGEFEDWFVPKSWNIHHVGDAATADLAYEIDLRLAEYANGDRTEEHLKLVLRPLLSTIMGHLGPVPPRTGSASVTVPVPVQPRWSPVPAGR